MDTNDVVELTERDKSMLTIAHNYGYAHGATDALKGVRMGVAITGAGIVLGYCIYRVVDKVIGYLDNKKSKLK